MRLLPCWERECFETRCQTKWQGLFSILCTWARTSPYVKSLCDFPDFFFFCGYCALLSRGHLFPIFSPPVCGKLNTVGLQHACRATSLQDGQFQHVGPCELKPVLALFICPRLSNCSIYSLGLIHGSLGQSDQFCQALFAFSKGTRGMASALCNSHLCLSFVLAVSFLGGKSDFLIVHV